MSQTRIQANETYKNGHGTISKIGTKKSGILSTNFSAWNIESHKLCPHQNNKEIFFRGVIGRERQINQSFKKDKIAKHWIKKWNQGDLIFALIGLDRGQEKLPACGGF